MTAAPLHRASPSAPVALARPRRGNRLSSALGRGALRLAGWRLEGEFPEIPRFVVIVAPHTSNWDFPLGVAAMFAHGLRAHWIGKHTLFRGPATAVLRWLGGEPVDRAAPGGIVEAIVARFRAEPQYVLALSPEGTRRRIEAWRTGFHRIAVGAAVPVVPAWIDWDRRVIGIGAPVALTGDVDADLARLRAHYARRMARYPELYVE